MSQKKLYILAMLLTCLGACKVKPPTADRCCNCHTGPAIISNLKDVRTVERVDASRVKGTHWSDDMILITLREGRKDSMLIAQKCLSGRVNEMSAAYLGARDSVRAERMRKGGIIPLRGKPVDDSYQMAPDPERWNTSSGRKQMDSIDWTKILRIVK